MIRYRPSILGRITTETLSIAFIKHLGACISRDCIWLQVKVKVKVAYLCLTLCDPMDYSVHGILQVRILKWVAFPFFRGSSQPRDQTQVSCIAGRFFSSWATRNIYIQSCGFPVIIYGCKSWTIKKAEHWRTDAFELWCWRRLLRVPWTARSNQSVLKEISPEYYIHWKDWCWNSNTLATWCEEPTHWKRPQCLERLRAGGEGGVTGWGGWMASLIRWTWVWANSDRQWTGKPGMLQSVGLQRVGHDLVNEQQQQRKTQ